MARNTFIELPPEEIKRLTRSLRFLADSWDRKTTRKIAQRGATPVAQAERQLVKPKARADQYRLKKGPRSGKLVKVPREQKKYSTRGLIGTFLPGNLRRSMNRIPRLNKTGDAFVGPVARKAGGKYGSTVGNANGYYAAMKYGSASAFRMEVRDPAVIKARGKSLKIMEALVLAEVDKRKKKNGFR